MSTMPAALYVTVIPLPLTFVTAPTPPTNFRKCARTFGSV
jgi:hypothetical protein